jgi:hypothetical protein
LRVLYLQKYRLFTKKSLSNIYKFDVTYLQVTNLDLICPMRMSRPFEALVYLTESPPTATPSHAKKLFLGAPPIFFFFFSLQNLSTHFTAALFLTNVLPMQITFSGTFVLLVQRSFFNSRFYCCFYVVDILSGLLFEQKKKKISRTKRICLK